MKNSVQDIVAKKVAPIFRKLHDVNVKILGTKCEVLRIDMSEPDLRGETDETLNSIIIENAIINKPFGSIVQLFENYDEETKQIDTGSLDIFEFLPIILKIPFSGDSDIIPVAVKRGDLIVEILQDEHGNKLPLIMQVTKILGAFQAKYINGKKYEMALYRQTLTAMIKDRIDKYVSGELG